MRKTLGRLALLLLLGLAQQAAALDAVLPATAWRAAPGQALLLGEVHDNAAQHALRAQTLAALLALGDRPALLLEAFDREHQPAIDTLLQAEPGAGAAALEARIEALIDAGGRAAGWHWAHYRPYLRLALQHGLPVVAANVSRAEARRIMQLGLAPTGWQAEVPADIGHAQAAAMAASHCGQVDAEFAARLADAQVARDQFMARMIGRHAERGAVLLAGNGHVRRDIGVPRWLSVAQRERSQVVGFLEPGDEGGAAAYDAVVVTAAQPRTDPCDALRRAPMPATPASR